jgi:hypothetical protein
MGALIIFILSYVNLPPYNSDRVGGIDIGYTNGRRHSVFPSWRVLIYYPLRPAI